MMKTTLCAYSLLVCLQISGNLYTLPVHLYVLVRSEKINKCEIAKKMNSQLAAEPTRQSNFLIDRGNILEEINQFLFIVLRYCMDLEDRFNYTPDEIACKIGKNLTSLIKSLCFIHGLFGYPKSSTNTEDSAEIEVNMGEVENILLNDVKEENKNKKTMRLVDYCEKEEQDKFCRFEFSNETTSLDSSLREPAHIFLEMVRHMFSNKEDNNNERASTIGKKFLESLPDKNYLKPTVWAEHKTRPDLECFGVSLGAHSFVRPLFLYIKLNQLLRDGDENGVQLENVKALQCVDRSEEYDNDKPSGYDKDIEPCKSCQIFFGGFQQCDNRRVTFFGNCAEYDVIRTNALKITLLDSNGRNWSAFKTACEKQFKSFMTFNANLKKMEQSENPMGLYHNYKSECEANPKKFRYKWNKKKGCYRLIY